MTPPAFAASTSAALAGAFVLALAMGGCQDVSRFSSSGDHYQGAVVGGSFVLAGFDAGTSLCLVLDATNLQSAPGTLTSNDGRFVHTPLRPIPEVWRDPLSTLTFGEGRVQNLLYIATPLADVDAQGDVTVVLSLMQSGSVELRLFRGAPDLDGGAVASQLFGVFTLTRAPGQCSP